VKGVPRNEHSDTRTQSPRRPVDRDDPGAIEDQVRLVLFVPMGVKRASGRQPSYANRQALAPGQPRADQRLRMSRSPWNLATAIL
jgi:hypothetical protein